MNDVAPERPPATSSPIRWPDIPACYGWLSLDRRGAWRLKGEVIHHGGMIEFINRNYGPDGTGNWVFRNGPQLVFVDLDYTPFVLRLQVDGRFLLHTGQSAGTPAAAFVDEEGQVLIAVEGGIGLVDDRDLGRFIDGCCHLESDGRNDGSPAQVAGGETRLSWQGLALHPVSRRVVPGLFGFEPLPRPD